MAPNAFDEDQPIAVCECCHRYFDDCRHSPLLLPCGHVYCRDCLSNKEDQGDQVCHQTHQAGASGSWSNKSLGDLPVVYSMVPRDEGLVASGRMVAPAPGGGASAGSWPPAARSVAPTSSYGRAVAPGPMRVGRPGSVKMEKKVGTLHGCVACGQHYNESNRRPLLLNCGHSFCRECLVTRGQQNNASCPCCSEHWDPRSVDRLPAVLSLIRPSGGPTRSPSVAPSTTSAARSASTAALHDDKLPIFVTNINGRKQTTHVNLNDNVESLRERVSTGFNVKPEHQQLLHEGKTLQNGRSLGSYNIRPKSNVNMVCRQRGGA